METDSMTKYAVSDTIANCAMEIADSLILVQESHSP